MHSSGFCITTEVLPVIMLTAVCASILYPLLHKYGAIHEIADVPFDANHPLIDEKTLLSVNRMSRWQNRVC